MIEFDPRPPPAIAQQLAAVPSYAVHRDLFWYDWGPVFYRRRLDGSARVLGIASDPGPRERIAGARSSRERREAAYARIPPRETDPPLRAWRCPGRQTRVAEG